MTSPVDSQPKLTLAEKVWRDHVVTHGTGDEPDLIFIDLQLLHEVTSPQAFDGLRLAGRTLRHPELHLATEDHNVPTTGIKTGDLTEIADSISRTQVSTLRKNCEEFGVRLHAMGDINQGIVHQVGPQLGATQPGMTIVCGDSHTSTHGAFGAMAFGIGTSEVEHVMATQTLALKPFKTMAINVTGELQPGVTAKDLILAIIAKIGTGSSREHAVWALMDYGFKVVLSSRFADIFRGNAGKAGLLAALMDQQDIEQLWQQLTDQPGLSLTVNLEDRTVTCENHTYRFDVDDYTRWRLMEGLDDIGLTLRKEADIKTYEAHRPSFKPVVK